MTTACIVVGLLLCNATLPVFAVVTTLSLIAETTKDYS